MSIFSPRSSWTTDWTLDPHSHAGAHRVHIRVPRVDGDLGPAPGFRAALMIWTMPSEISGDFQLKELGTKAGLLRERMIWDPWGFSDVQTRKARIRSPGL